uniref:Tetraspanin n=1 Tax=Parascaris univalens TaxID=6257 RepID=A0A915A0U8_PARUN
MEEEGEHRGRRSDGSKRRQQLTGVLLLLHFIQMALCFAAVLVCATAALRFYRYRKVLPHLMEREGLFIAVFSVDLLSFMVTAISLIRVHNFRVMSLATRSDLFAAMLAGGVTSAGVLTCAIVLLIGSGVWHESIRKDVQNVIKHAFENPDFAELSGDQPSSS